MNRIILNRKKWLPERCCFWATKQYKWNEIPSETLHFCMNKLNWDVKTRCGWLGGGAKHFEMWRRYCHDIKDHSRHCITTALHASNTYHTFARLGEIKRLHRMNKWVCAFNFSYHLMVVWYFEIAYQLFKGPLKGYADLLGLKYWDRGCDKNTQHPKATIQDCLQKKEFNLVCLGLQ